LLALLGAHHILHVSEIRVNVKVSYLPFLLGHETFCNSFYNFSGYAINLGCQSKDDRHFNLPANWYLWIRSLWNLHWVSRRSLVTARTSTEVQKMCRKLWSGWTLLCMGDCMADCLLMTGSFIH